MSEVPPAQEPAEKAVESGELDLARKDVEPDESLEMTPEEERKLKVSALHVSFFSPLRMQLVDTHGCILSFFFHVSVASISR
jgi:hypothetical protein